MPVETIVKEKTPFTKIKGEREIYPRDKIKITSGLHQESKIALYKADYIRSPKAIVFVYPSKCKLDSDKIASSLSEYANVNGPLIEREFKDLSTPELSRTFFKRIHPLMSDFDYDYQIDKVQIKAHLFNPKATEYLKGGITDI